MLIEYDDVKSRINEPPKWYTSEGYPRYCDFSPRETGVYVKYALLVEIQCQACGEKFMVGEGYNRENWNAIMRGDKENVINDLEKIVKHYHYGDPPSHSCSGGGETMNCEDIRFVEVWEYQQETGEKELKDGSTITIITNIIGWVRRPDLEKPCEYWVDNLENNNDAK